MFLCDPLKDQSWVPASHWLKSREEVTFEIDSPMLETFCGFSDVSNRVEPARWSRARCRMPFPASRSCATEVGAHKHTGNGKAVRASCLGATHSGDGNGTTNGNGEWCSPVARPDVVAGSTQH